MDVRGDGCPCCRPAPGGCAVWQRQRRGRTHRGELALLAGTATLRHVDRRAGAVGWSLVGRRLRGAAAVRCTARGGTARSGATVVGWSCALELDRAASAGLGAWRARTTARARDIRGGAVGDAVPVAGRSPRSDWAGRECRRRRLVLDHRG